MGWVFGDSDLWNFLKAWENSNEDKSGILKVLPMMKLSKCAELVNISLLQSFSGFHISFAARGFGCMMKCHELLADNNIMKYAKVYNRT